MNFLGFRVADHRFETSRVDVQNEATLRGFSAWNAFGKERFEERDGWDGAFGDFDGDALRDDDDGAFVWG